MLMASPLGQTVTVQEAGAELTARGYYPLNTTTPPAISPGIIQIQPVTAVRPPVSPAGTYPTGEWITDRYPPGYDPVVEPVSPPLVLFVSEPGPAVSPGIYDEFITRSVQPVTQRVAMAITIEPPLDLPALVPEDPYSPLPDVIFQEFPEIPKGLEVPYSPPADFYEIPYSPPADFLPFSPPAELQPTEDKKTVWIVIAVLGAAVLFTGDKKKRKKRSVENYVDNY